MTDDNDVVFKQRISTDRTTIQTCLDFAENYSFVAQDAVQGFHWKNSQATIHPFVAYFKQLGELQHKSMCVISDCLQHDTITVHRFQKDVLNYLQKTAPHLSNFFYFSDGAPSQYKNFKIFANLVCHQRDFGMAFFCDIPWQECL